MIGAIKARKTVDEFLRSGFERAVVNRSGMFTVEPVADWRDPLEKVIADAGLDAMVDVKGDDVALVRKPKKGNR